MANQITGTVHLIEPAVSIPLKSDPTRSLTKRTLVLCVKRFNPVTGEQDVADNFPAFEFLNDRCALLDSFAPGQLVTVSFDLQGSQVTGQDGHLRWFTSIRGYRIEHYQRQGYPAQQQPQASAQPQQAYMPQRQPLSLPPQPMASPVYQQQSYPQAPQQQYPGQPVQPQQGQGNDLPF